MDLAAAKATLKSLIEGVDPVTGYPIPKSMVLHLAVVIRALLCALNERSSSRLKLIAELLRKNVRHCKFIDFGTR